MTNTDYTQKLIDRINWLIEIAEEEYEEGDIQITPEIVKKSIDLVRMLQKSRGSLPTCSASYTYTGDVGIYFRNIQTQKEGRTDRHLQINVRSNDYYVFYEPRSNSTIEQCWGERYSLAADVVERVLPLL